MNKLENKIKANKALFEKKIEDNGTSFKVAYSKKSSTWENGWGNGWSDGKTFKPIMPASLLNPSTAEE